MKTVRPAIVAGALACAAFAATADAQNYTLPPAYGTVELESGFLPDPHSVGLQAGGELHVDHTGKGEACEGYVAEAPDYRLIYTDGDYQLAFYVRSSADTILLVNAPDGTWYCNDDYDGLNPAIVFGSPSSGQYDIWVGTFSPGSLPEATLYVTEMTPFE